MLDLSALDILRMINSHNKVTTLYITRKENLVEETLQKSQTKNLESLEEVLTLLLEGSHVKPLAFQDLEGGLKMLEEQCSLKLQGQLNKSNHAIYS